MYRIYRFSNAIANDTVHAILIAFPNDRISNTREIVCTCSLFAGCDSCENL